MQNESLKIADLEGKISKVFDLESAIRQADFFRGLRHELPQFKNLDDQLHEYWDYVYQKLIDLKKIVYVQQLFFWF